MAALNVFMKGVIKLAYSGYYDEMFGKLNIKKSTYTAASLQYWYKYYKTSLFQRILPLFVWDTKNEIPDREIEKTLLLGGMACVTDKYKNARGKLAVFNANFAGAPTVYYDRYTQVAFNCPLDARILTIDKDASVGFNNSTHTGVDALIHSFAIILAHTELTIVNMLINARENYVATGSTNKDVEIWRQYRNQLVSGAVGALQDRGIQSIDVKTFPSNTSISIADLQEFKKNTIEMFLNMCGIKTTHEKKGNMIKEEVDANDSMLIFNLEDMFTCRVEFCNRVNDMYNRAWSVRKADCIDYEKMATAVDEERSDDDV